jgi:hypothetical protein
MNLDDEIRNINDRLKRLEKLDSSLEDVILFCDCYDFIDYKSNSHRAKIKERVIDVLKKYLDLYKDNTLKFEYAYILRENIFYKEESIKLRDEALKIDPELRKTKVFYMNQPIEIGW